MTVFVNYEISMGFSAEFWRRGVQSPFLWNPKVVPHLMISGITGGGKTVLSQYIVNQLLDAPVELYICDFKAGGDWDGIVSNYAEYQDCDDMLDKFYLLFIQTIQEKNHRNAFLVFDEFSSYALSKDSKDFKALMSKVSHIAFMGRSFGFHLILISQQFNSKVIDTAIRDQFGIKIFMGSTISTESATMLFPNCSIDKSKHLPPYSGYISLPEKDLDVIQLPFIENADDLKKLLCVKGKENHN